MQILHIFDENNYNPEWRKIFREAARAVIIKNNKIALVKSKTDGYFKFPGGGIEQGESHFDTLIRETNEETGLHIIQQSITEMGMVHELRKGLYGEEIFEQKSYYYYADADDTVTVTKLDDYEKDLGYELIWSDIETAYKINAELGKNYETTFIIREAYVLKYLMENPHYIN